MTPQDKETVVPSSLILVFTTLCSPCFRLHVLLLYYLSLHKCGHLIVLLYPHHFPSRVHTLMFIKSQVYFYQKCYIKTPYIFDEQNRLQFIRQFANQ